jgi:hypothetical protein
MSIYTRLRRSELLDLTVDPVNINRDYLDVLGEVHTYSAKEGEFQPAKIESMKRSLYFSRIYYQNRNTIRKLGRLNAKSTKICAKTPTNRSSRAKSDSPDLTVLSFASIP